METKHTPAPWHVRSFDGSCWSVDVAGDLTVAQAQQLRPLYLDPKQEERSANARLIAAAPELLKLLMDIQADSTWRSSDNTIYPRLNNIIRQATGRTG